jgi:hypothetical protein
LPASSEVESFVFGSDVKEAEVLQRHMMAQMLIERSILEEETDRGSEAKSHVYLIAFGKPAGHREVAPREFDVHSRWKPAREAEEKSRRRRIRRIRKEDEDKAVKRKRLV